MGRETQPTSTAGKTTASDITLAIPPQVAWETMVKQVLVHGNPQAVRNAAVAWEEIFVNLYSVRTNLIKNASDLETFGAWSGPAFDVYEAEINKIAKKIEGIVHAANGGRAADGTGRDVTYALNRAANLLENSGLPYPENATDDITAAKNIRASNADAIRPGRFEELLRQKANSEQADFWVAFFNDWYIDETQQARQIYNTLNTNVKSTGQQLPDQTRQASGPVNPSVSQPGAGSPSMPSPGGGSMPDLGGNAAGQPPLTDNRPPTGTGAGPNIPDPKSDPSGQNAPRQPPPPGTIGPDGLDQRPPTGGGLASNSGLTSGGGGFGNGGISTSGGGVSGGGGPFDSRSAPGLGGAGGPLGGRPVSPPFMGVPPGGTMGGQSGRGQRSGRTSRVSPGAVGGMPANGGKRDSGGAGTSNWLREDSDVWEPNKNVPPPVLNGEDW